MKRSQKQRRLVQTRWSLAPLLALALLLTLALGLAACGGDGGGAGADEQEEGTGSVDPGEAPPRVSGQPTVTSSGLQIFEIQAGTGEEARPGAVIYVKYSGWLADDTQFESTSEPLRFVLREGQVIQGWLEGIVGMKEGGKRRLIVPPDLGYGEEGAGNVIPPDATLTFDIELVDAR